MLIASQHGVQALAMIGQLYEVEEQVPQLPADKRCELRKLHRAPVLERLRAWLDDQAPVVLPKSQLGEAIGYARNQWQELCSYLLDGRLPIDNKDVERDPRALTIGRKNWLLIGGPTAGPRAVVILVGRR